MSVKSVVLSIMRRIPLPLKKCIVLESKPDFSDNTKAVFDELLRRKINEKVKLIWLVDNKLDKYPAYKNVKYIDSVVKHRYYRVRSKILVCCNEFLVPKSKNQLSIYLTHGLPIKSVRGYYAMPEGIQYLISPSEYVNEIMSREFNVPLEKIASLGYPRNDILTKSNQNIRLMFSTEFDKIVVWYPTFRQSRNGKKYGGDAMPIIHDAEKAVRINEYAMKYKTLIVLKPHFAQDVSYITDLKLSNIVIINDDFFYNNNISNYEFLSGCDALITDYSSVYYDYTLCNKPIAVIWEDIEEYKKSPGIAVDLDKFLKGAEKIYCEEEFCEFIRNVSLGNDLLSKERNEVKNLVTFTDGKSAERVVDFIVKYL